MSEPVASLQIVADENMPAVEQYFADLGSIRRCLGRSLTAEDIADADILLVRSVTRINADLLAQSPVRFVGTATIGVDHVDTEYLQARGIAFASAPGSNARSVAEFVLASLLRRFHADVKSLQSCRAGIVGYGNVGRAVAELLSRFGIECCAYDPLLDAVEFPLLTTLEEVFARDIVCLHAPLTRTGPFPSDGMIEAALLSSLNPGAILISAGRGECVDETALKNLLRQRDDIHAVLDVWQGEPDIDSEALKMVAQGSPHVAGYSFDGKVAGTRMLREAWDRLNLGQGSAVSPSTEALLPLELRARTAQEQIVEAVLAACDPGLDDRLMRQALLDSVCDNIGIEFDRMRKAYRQRREFPCYCVSGAVPEAERVLAKLGFAMSGHGA